MRISQNVKSVFFVKSSADDYRIKTKILTGFQICISVPLNINTEIYKILNSLNPRFINYKFKVKMYQRLLSDK